MPISQCLTLFWQIIVPGSMYTQHVLVTYINTFLGNDMLFFVYTFYNVWHLMPIYHVIPFKFPFFFNVSNPFST